MINVLDIFPSKNGISSHLIPVAIILGSPNTYDNKLKIIFGEYAQIYIVNTKSTNQRTVGEILVITPNRRGGYCCMSLATGKQIHGFI